MRARTPARSIKEDPGAIEENGSDVNGIGKIISKMLGTMIHRKLKFETKIYQEKTDTDSSKTKILDGVDVEINTSPGEFV